MRLCGKDGKDQQSLHYRTTEFFGVLFGFFANVSFVSLLQSTFHQFGKANATWYSSFKMLTDPHHSYPCCLRPDVTKGVRWQCNRGKELSSAGLAITFSQSFCVVQLNLVAQAASVVLTDWWGQSAVILVHSDLFILHASPDSILTEHQCKWCRS